MERNELLAQGAHQILDAAVKQNLPVKLLGGLAVYLTCPATKRAPFAREIADMDFIVSKKRSSEFGKLLVALGYEGDHQFNSIHGETRLLYASADTDVDVFVGVFQQCHELDLSGALTGDAPTIPLAQLLLTKLQIVQINRKDELDALAILCDHDVRNKGGADDIDLGVIVALTSNDWGWFTTVSDNLAKLGATADEALDGDAPLVHQRLDAIAQAMQQAPKSMKWKMRDKIGRRVPWYDLPEEKRL